ncbi:ABZJ_00895 family protein [Mesorhizobium sp. PAMC28654]|uniref:ABZJ_00895 family protein n=1 Tax=Mesorhizobium sp. PAMC28654 TaxID=2880934 RepID=UPI001D0A3158|nr:ABZJ_00895 family protein [Mesorhizobium sp. PAMC28654]UDL88634.1 ABZJ_00895 family protein [Mesorhizobium sp. PAMC28654]
MTSVDLIVFRRFIYFFISSEIAIAALDYIMKIAHVIKSNRNNYYIVFIPAISASKDALDKFHLRYRRAPTRQEYWRLVVFSTLVAAAFQSALWRFTAIYGNPQNIPTHLRPEGIGIVVAIFSLVALGYSGLNPFKPRNGNTGTTHGKPE